MDDAQQSIEESLETAKDLTIKIAETNKEMVNYMVQYANSKAGNKLVSHHATTTDIS